MLQRDRNIYFYNLLFHIQVSKNISKAQENNVSQCDV